MGWTCDTTIASAVRCVLDSVFMDYLGTLMQAAWFAAAGILGLTIVLGISVFFRRL